MLWILMGLLVVIGGLLAFRRRQGYESTEREPWRASLASDEPLDVDEARRAEEEWLETEEWEEPPEDDTWR